MQKEIEESAASYHERYRFGQDIIVGVNKYVTDTIDEVDILEVDPEAEVRQLARLKQFKANRDQAGVDSKLEELREAARGEGNLMRPMREALAAERINGRGLQRHARRFRRVPGRLVLLTAMAPRCCWSRSNRHEIVPIERFREPHPAARSRRTYPRVVNDFVALRS